MSIEQKILKIINLLRSVIELENSNHPPITWQNETNGGVVASVFPRFSQFGFHSYTTKHCL